MSKRLILILSLVLSMGVIATFAYAEVQNVKVSGDLITLGVARYGFNLTAPEADATAIAGVVRVRIDTDFTDGVSSTIRLLNERIWGSLDEASPVTGTTDMHLDLAYVTLKEFLYSPLTLVVGRQEIFLGSGLICADPWTNRTTGGSSVLPTGTGDLSVRKAFDAIVGVFDYSPWTLILGMVEGVESSVTASTDDINVWAVDLTYDFGSYDAIGNFYYIVQDQTNNDINNYGIRFVGSPLDNLTANAEFAYQTARRATGQTGHRSDRALLLGTSYAFPDVAWSPTLGVDYTHLSDNWGAMFEGLTPADIINAIFINTNSQIIGVTLTAKPAEDITARLRYANIRLVEQIATLTNLWGNNTMTSKKDLGNELDLSLTYDYTEDVQLGVTVGYFEPGKAFASPREDATQVIGSMVVSF